MITRHHLIALSVALVLGWGCGDAGSEVTETEPVGTETTAETTEEPSVEATATPEVEEPEPAPVEPEPAMTAETLDPSEPIRPNALREAVLGLFGEPVVVEAYLFDPDEGENSLFMSEKLAAEPGQTSEEAAILECQNSVSGEVAAEDAIYMRGMVPVDYYGGDGPYGEEGPADFDDCEVVSTGEPPADVAVMTLDEYAARTVGWIGREVTVSGYFKGSSTNNRAEGGPQITVELTETAEAGFGDIAVNCAFPAGYTFPEGVSIGSEVTFRGTVTADRGFRDRVHLADCELIER